MKKIRYRHDWERGHMIEKTLSRSFDTIQDAQSFADGKNVIDIYKSNGRYKVEWVKTKDNNG